MIRETCQWQAKKHMHQGKKQLSHWMTLFHRHAVQSKCCAKKMRLDSGCFPCKPRWWVEFVEQTLLALDAVNQWSLKNILNDKQLEKGFTNRLEDACRTLIFKLTQSVQTKDKQNTISECQHMYTDRDRVARDNALHCYSLVMVATSYHSAWVPLLGQCAQVLKAEGLFYCYQEQSLLPEELRDSNSGRSHCCRY